MSFVRTSGGLTRSGLTARDLLVGALLALDDSLKYLDGVPDHVRTEQLRRLISELCAIAEAAAGGGE